MNVLKKEVQVADITACKIVSLWWGDINAQSPIKDGCCFYYALLTNECYLQFPVMSEYVSCIELWECNGEPEYIAHQEFPLDFQQTAHRKALGSRFVAAWRDVSSDSVVLETESGILITNGWSLGNSTLYIEDVADAGRKGLERFP